VNWKNNGISCLWSEYLSKKIYRDIEEKPREDVIQAVDDGLKPHKHLKRAITEDILRLLDIESCVSLNLIVIRTR
jgi:hypothetical protein